MMIVVVVVMMLLCISEKDVNQRKDLYVVIAIAIAITSTTKDVSHQARMMSDEGK
jgi:hypothetical protein